MIVRATFCGVLADEKCLKSVFYITGQAGSVPCHNCLNVRNRWCKLREGEQFFWDPAIENRKQTKRGHIDIVAPDEPALRAAIERANAMPESKSVCIKLTASTVSSPSPRTRTMTATTSEECARGRT